MGHSEKEMGCSGAGRRNRKDFSPCRECIAHTVTRSNTGLVVIYEGQAYELDAVGVVILQNLVMDPSVPTDL